MYTEIQHQGMSYFIRPQNMEGRVFSLGTKPSMDLMAMSDFVVNTQTNEIVKCRQMAVDIVRGYCNQCV